MKVIIRTAAEEDLHRIFDWIKQDNPAAATRMVARIRDRINFLELEHFQEKWPPVFRRKCDQISNLEPDSDHR
jgi:plasmid stabilization system protein ParE